MGKFYFTDLEYDSVWEVTEVDTADPKRLGWVTAFCVKEGEDHKAFIGQQMGIDAGMVFNRPERYDVSMERFTSTTTLSAEQKGGGNNG